MLPDTQPSRPFTPAVQYGGRYAWDGDGQATPPSAARRATDQYTGGGAVEMAAAGKGPGAW